MRNPLSRKPKSPIDQALAVANNVRADAAGIAGTVRDAASKAADALGEAAPDPKGSRVPVIGAAVAAGVGVAVAVRSRLKGSPETPAATGNPSAVETAAKTSTVPKPDPQASKPAGEVAAEKPVDPKADTAESDAAKS